MNTTGFSKMVWLWLLVLSSGCQVDELFDGDELPVSENGVYTEDGRFFVAAGEHIHEVIGGPHRYALDPVVEDAPCFFGGLVARGNVLYATCTKKSADGSSEPAASASLWRVFPGTGRDYQSVDFPVYDKRVQLNGMAFGPQGRLYISNSSALSTQAPAVYAVDIDEGEELAIQVSSFLQASRVGPDFSEGGGLYPNGVQIEGDMLYLVRGKTLVRMRILPDGQHGPMHRVFKAPGTNAIDDFALVGGHLLIAEMNLLGPLDRGAFPSHLVWVNPEGDVVDRVELPVAPSSVAIRRDSLFGPNAALVTSYANGGLYRVRVPAAKLPLAQAIPE